MRSLQLIRSLVCMGQYYTIKTPTPLLELWPVISRQTGNSHRTSRTRTIKTFTTRSGYLSFLPHLPSTLQHRTITLLIHSSPSSHSLSILYYRTSTLFFILHSRPSLSLSRPVVSFKPHTQIDGDRDAHPIFPCQNSQDSSVHTTQQGVFATNSRIRYSCSSSRLSNPALSIERAFVFRRRLVSP